MSPRPYRSPLREEHAGLTRRRLVAAAIELFESEGFAAATVDLIAERAGVSRRTVFSSVGGKASLLKLAFDHTLAGDDEPVAIADRPEVRQMMDGTDPGALLDGWTAMNARIAQRITGLYHVLVVAADTDTDAAALLADTDRQRAAGNRALVGRLDALDALRSGLDLEHAAAVADVLIDPSLYRRLVDIHHWPFEKYVSHVQHLAITSLLGAPHHRPPPTLLSTT
jgi:AcrR family transcriptional regulator